jgi:acetyltransferase-like isoleucine patch superfamily enzyme
MLRDTAKRLARVVATIAVAPALLSFWLRAWVLGRDRALEGSTQSLALLPGLIGRYLRQAFLSRVLAECDTSATIEFGTIFSQCGARIGANAYIGPRCHIGFATIEHDALLAAGVHVPSGAHTHGTNDPDVPIRDQATMKRMVRIGAGSWIGSAAVVMADVGNGAVVGAGAVVTRQIPEQMVAVGVPARTVRRR